MSWKSECLALIFGMLIILIIFGDAMPTHWVGNLDTVFGQTIWPVMDVVYPLASIVVFLAYGRSKGVIKIRFKSSIIFLGFLISLFLMQFDDFFVVFNHSIQLSNAYWTTVRWVYLVTSISTFLFFGLECQNLKRSNNPI